jgi:ParB family chromosome partitioning protein
MSKIEEGKVVNNLLDREGITQKELAGRLGVSSDWVNDRMRVALDLEPEVKGLVEAGDLSYTLARVVRRIDENRQLEFAELLIDNDVTTETEAGRLRKRFENDTIVTVGYEGQDFKEFIAELTENDVEVLVDVRASGDSTYKPQFSSEYLADHLPDEGIEYRHEPELGVHRMIRNPYKDGAIGHDCFANWYDWWLETESDVDLESFVDDLVATGRPALMCIEESPTPNDDQDIYCHRHHLAETLQNIKDEGRPAFPNRLDL